MTQQFNPQTFKTKTSILIFGKSWAAPLVLYFDNPQKKYNEIQDILIKSASSPRLVEFEAIGPVKKVSILTNQIAGVAMQEEQHLG